MLDLWPLSEYGNVFILCVKFLIKFKAIGGGSGVKNESWAYIQVFHITDSALFTDFFLLLFFGPR